MNIIQMILIQFITFVFIVLFLRWLLQANISRAVKRLQMLNRQNMQKEKVLKEEIERAKKEADSEIEKGRNKAGQLMAEAKEEAGRVKEDVVGKSREEARRIIDEAMKDVKRRQDELMLEMQDRSVSIAGEMVKYIFTDKNLKNIHIQLLDELIEDIKSLDKKRFEAKEGKVEVLYAFKPTDRQKEELKKTLSAKLDRDIYLTEVHKPDIVAGIVIKMGGFVIDGSIENKLRKVIPVMKGKFIPKGD